MDNFSQILGHKRQITGLQRMMDAGRTPGVLVLSGPEHIGKATVARAFVSAVLGVPTEELSRHPDAVLLTPEIRDNGTRVYEIEAIRETLMRLGQSAVYGKTVVIIDDADALSTAGQNALLKTLEEPIGDTTIILIAHDIAALLPTVRSRSVVIPFFGQGPEASETMMEDVRRLSASSTVERLKAAQTIAKRDVLDADGLLAVLAHELHRTGKSSAKSLQSILATRDKIAVNGNSTVALEQLAVSLG